MCQNTAFQLQRVGRMVFLVKKSVKDLMWFYLLCSYRGTGGLNKTIFLAGSFYRHTFSPAAWHYIFFELQHQHDRGRGEGEEEGWKQRGCVSDLHRHSTHDQSVSETTEAGNTRPGQYGRWPKCTLCPQYCSHLKHFISYDLLAPLWTPFGFPNCLNSL